MHHDRRNDYDVTNTVQVSSPSAVKAAVRELFETTYPDGDFKLVAQAFEDFDRLFDGRLPGYMGCDTVYHDTQHTLDMTLAMARLLFGYEKRHAGDARLGSKRAIMGLITSLFHDSGYIRRLKDTEYSNGAEFTRCHVSRSAEFLSVYLPGIGLDGLASIATKIVHFTGYEIDFDDIEVADPLDRKVGHLLGTADLIAQMADRCYLEKCRDRLYAEFVLGGVAMDETSGGDTVTMYASGQDLLRKTPDFFDSVQRQRLEGEFESAYEYIDALFDGDNPYLEAITQNLAHLAQIIAKNDWARLRRSPPVFTWDKDALSHVGELMHDRLDRRAEQN